MSIRTFHGIVDFQVKAKAESLVALASKVKVIFLKCCRSDSAAFFVPLNNTQWREMLSKSRVA